MKPSVKSVLMTLLVGVALVILTTLSAASVAHAGTERWTVLARKVGQSEEDRAAAIKELKGMKHLHAKLTKAIYSSDRPLALDIISALDLKELIPDLLLQVPADPDGFLTVAVNSMMTDKNQSLILKSYQESIGPDNLAKVSPAAVVAMLEPLGRLAVKLPRPTLQALKDHASPEVRSSMLYYLRIMSLRNHILENLDFVAQLAKASEFQIRLQAVSVNAEILAMVKDEKTPGLLSRDRLADVCALEKVSQIKDACKGLVTPKISVKKA